MCNAANRIGAIAPAIELIRVFIEITIGNSALSAKLDSSNGIVALINTIPAPENMLPMMWQAILLKYITKTNERANEIKPYAIVFVFVNLRNFPKKAAVRIPPTLPRAVTNPVYPVPRPLPARTIDWLAINIVIAIEVKKVMIR